MVLTFHLFTFLFATAAVLVCTWLLFLTRLYMEGIADSFFGTWVCRFIGHRWGNKMHGRLCKRCRRWEATT